MFLFLVILITQTSPNLSKKFITLALSKPLSNTYIPTIPIIDTNLLIRTFTSSNVVLKFSSYVEYSRPKRGINSKKSFELLILVYFRDMFFVLKELSRVLKKDALSFIIIGDSAPYGVHIPTDVLLGEIAVGIGFSSYTIQPIRDRGVKWKSLKFRHNMKLRESLLILRR